MISAKVTISICYDELFQFQEENKDAINNDERLFYIYGGCHRNEIKFMID